MDKRVLGNDDGIILMNGRVWGKEDKSLEKSVEYLGCWDGDSALLRNQEPGLKMHHQSSPLQPTSIPFLLI